MQFIARISIITFKCGWGKDVSIVGELKIARDNVVNLALDTTTWNAFLVC